MNLIEFASYGWSLIKRGGDVKAKTLYGKKINFIFSVDENDCIGIGNKLAHVHAKDLALFRQKTMGGLVLMGMNTCLSLGTPLEGRVNLVMCDSGTDLPKGFVEMFSGEAVDAISSNEQDCIWVIGGRKTFQALSSYLEVDEVHLSFFSRTVPESKRNIYYAGYRGIIEPMKVVHSEMIAKDVSVVVYKNVEQGK